MSNGVKPLMSAVFFFLVGLAGCAGDNAATDGVDQGALSDQRPPSDRRPVQQNDDELKRNLEQMLAGVVFYSEADYPYAVFEAPAVRARTLTDRVLRSAISDQVQRITRREIWRSECRSRRLSLADVLEDATLPDTEENHDARQAGLAVKLMREQLLGVVGYSYGTNESGDQDEVGPVVYVYVGKSKISGKLIGILTQAAFT